ncbi:phosphatase PAP2 family protein [Cohnella zeiphila]|uniref:Phosphatase PAP2 family protein n=1 Tax=Cohnella zeiphila TaxID=2761120 RepID=A0A7X0SKN4_9BACL|nr:phosphatase PAP2 family protein [Cohnella zeiphila]MBB6731758.1 phosphatase PAP2 family protein [Cohnella zeiphila]
MAIAVRYRKYMPLLFMLIFPMLGAIYGWVDKPGKVIYHLTTRLDDAIPFVKYFAIPYGVWIFYIYLCVLYFFKKDIRVYYRALMVYTLCALVCYGIYSGFQTTVPRPVLVGHDPFTRLVAFIYHRDRPFNCFPSIHVFSSYMVFRLLAASGFRNARNLALIGGTSTAIILSTLFIKQHAIMDGIAGILLVEIVLAGVMYAERLLSGGQQERQRGTFGA